MAERAGYDQPGDGYTDKNAKYGVDAPPPYQPGIPPPQQGYGQQPYPMQPQYGHNTNTTVVVNQPQTGTIIIQQRHPDYMVPSICACLCCFFPTGILAIYYAYEANNLARDGDYEGARKMSDMARRLMVASVIVGVISLFFAVVKCLTVYESYKSSSYKY
ncbi:trafficking regulator of GLUT4 1-like isoform X3 [Ruditapes philippinarum]|uniref:trafficking regulator of GLUT4 1-like isoform X3 n=1 Tax=Ruditapes philippinarum TaxID=129788 RepID=UPI00295A6A06|nr:trafficking regulator of GLUT4 1-like isoform X3 [Ruditapes philippinarum]